MANELSNLFRLNWVNGTRKLFRKFSHSVTVTGTDAASFHQNIGTSEEVLAFPADFGTPGYMMLINHDTTNYIEVGPSTGNYLIKIEKGEACQFRATVAKTSFYCKANTGACDLEVTALED